MSPFWNASIGPVKANHATETKAFIIFDLLREMVWCQKWIVVIQMLSDAYGSMELCFANSSEGDACKGSVFRVSQLWAMLHNKDAPWLPTS